MMGNAGDVVVSQPVLGFQRAGTHEQYRHAREISSRPLTRLARLTVGESRWHIYGEVGMPLGPRMFSSSHNCKRGSPTEYLRHECLCLCLYPRLWQAKNESSSVSFPTALEGLTWLARHHSWCCMLIMWTMLVAFLRCLDCAQRRPQCCPGLATAGGDAVSGIPGRG